MEKFRALRRAALAAGFVVGSVCSLVGCGSGDSGAAPKPISPEAEQATMKMLQNYGKDAQAQGRANATKAAKKP